MAHHIAAKAAPATTGNGLQGSASGKKIPAHTEKTSHQQVGWRDVLPVHPAAELFPLMGENDLRELADDIAGNGQIEPIDIYQNSVLDGRNRLDALALIGRGLDRVHLRYLPDNDPDFDPFAYVLSKNIRRRHLTPEQKIPLIVALLKLQPEKSNRQIAKLVDASHPYVAKVRRKGEQSGDVEAVSTSIDTKGRKQPVKPRGMTQPRKLGIFNRSISLICNHCQDYEDSLNNFLPRLTDEQKADAQRQLWDAIDILHKCVARVAKASAP